MAAAVRYKWMFRTAAVVFVLFGSFALFQPAQRPIGLACGAVAIAIGVFLFRRARFAIGLSALGAGLVCLSATVSAPQAKGPVILFLALLALATGIYAALSLRVLFEQKEESTNRS
jgi:hypothetical protein